MAESLVDFISQNAPERTIYANSPIALALCQVRFVRKYRLSNESAVAPFQEALEGAYPNATQSLSQAAEVQISGTGVGVQPIQPSPLWQFSDEDENWTVTLAPDFVTLETRAYEHFEDFLSRLTFVLQALAETIKPSLCRRIGLRYIDEIRSPSRAWSSIVRPEVLGLPQIPVFRASCEQSVQVLSLEAGSAKITLQHGVFPTGSTVIPKRGAPAQDDPFYLIDIDMYRDLNPPHALQMSSDHICPLVQQYHDVVSALFRWATTDKYRASLGERENAD